MVPTSPFQPSSGGHHGGKALRAQEVTLSSLYPPSVAVNSASCLILITDDPPWSNYNGLLPAQFGIYLAVSSWLSPLSIQFVFIEHLLCLEGRVCPHEDSKCWSSSLQGREGSWWSCLQAWTCQQNDSNVRGASPQGRGWFHMGLVNTPGLLL